jgi:uncharacterized coiled-coil protein SlyX/effector-binding domain-containing protein
VRFKLAGARVLTFGYLLVIIVLSSQSVPAETPTPSPSPAATADAKTTSATQTSKGTSSAETGSAGTTVAKLPEIKVTGVSGQLALYNTISVAVENLSDYLKQPGKVPENFILYIDWRPLKGVNSRLGFLETKEGEKTVLKDVLLFDIKRTEESKPQWNALLGRPLWGKKGFDYNVPVSIGYADEKPIPTDVKNYELEVVNKAGFWIFVGAFVFSLYLFWWLAKHKGIIRDPCPDLPPEQRPYSLGRTQMAFWFFVIAASYVLIWMITSDRDSLTEQALALLGISTATALGAAIVGSSKTNADETKRQALELEKSTITNRLEQFEQERAAQPEKLSDLNKEKAEKGARLEQIKKELAGLTERVKPQTSEGFRTDILSDAEGISLHRFQMAIWTIVLGIIFVASVFNSLAMPELSGTLLALMGISGGTYIGFKFPEKPG